MNEYEAKQEAKRERYLERAAKASAQSEQYSQTGREVASRVPLGQPILIGHHSEGRMRAHYKRLQRLADKSLEEYNKAAHYRSKAASVGKGGVSSDDPDAVQKLQKKLAKLEHYQANMKAANAIIRSAPKNQETPEKLQELQALGFNIGRAHSLFTPDFCGRVGFPGYATTNNSAKIRRYKERIAALQNQPTETKTTQRGSCEVIENAEENRIQLVFEGKPPVETRQVLKQNGFRWSRTNMAWQRHLNNAGRGAAERVLTQIERAERCQ